MSEADFIPSEYVSVGLKPDPEELLTADREPDHFIRWLEGRVVLFEDDESTEIGRYRAFYIDAESAMHARMPLFDVFDSMQETCDYLELYEADSWAYSAAALKAAGAGYLLFEPNLLILDRLEILPPYRGRGYGLHALIGMMHWFQAGAGLVAMKPFPLQFESAAARRGPEDPMELAKLPTNEVAARTKLRRYYAQLGFKLVAKTPFMVRRVDQAPPAVPVRLR
ncbi:hypothetical protein [Roseateles sp.]|uniref:hypothetical protein n=1 Tax=Roseateles sp. TaxID=1971397 RepID=UPI003BAB8604